MKLELLGRFFAISAVSSLLLAITVAKDHAAMTNASPAQNDKRILSMAEWRVSGKNGRLWCTLLAKPASNGGDKPALPESVFTVYREDQGVRQQVFSMKMEDNILNIYPLGDYDARLIITSVGGSGYHFCILAYVDEQVKEVLNETSKLPIEVIYDDQGRESLLFTEPRIEKGKWTPIHGATRIFQWRVDHYDQIGTVPWSERFQCLTKESCAALK